MLPPRYGHQANEDQMSDASRIGSDGRDFVGRAAFSGNTPPGSPKSDICHLISDLCNLGLVTVYDEVNIRIEDQADQAISTG